MKSKELMKLLEQNGWKLVRTKGSHNMYQKKDNPKTIPVPFHNTDLGIGLLNQILKDAGLK